LQNIAENELPAPMKCETAVIPAKVTKGNGEPVLAWVRLLDPGFRRGDHFIYLQAGAIGTSEAIKAGTHN